MFGAAWSTEKVEGDVGAAQARLPVEYSNMLDEQALATFVHGGLDPQQVLYTEPLDAAGAPHIINTSDFNVTGHEDIDVDALATHDDAYFQCVTGNACDLFASFGGDLPNPPGWAAYYERPNGVVSGLWRQMDLCNAGGGVDGSVEDVDALELYGPLDVGDTDKFSLVGDPAGVSVWSAAGAVPGPYIPHALVFGAVSFLGYIGDSAAVDLDALMVDADEDSLWEPGETILFSIRAAGNWDGGEIVVMPFAGAPWFLVHGGHVWNTAFGVAATFNVGTEEVDGLEAGNAKNVPGATTKYFGALIDRSGSMKTKRTNGNSRCFDAKSYAIWDIQQFAKDYPHALFTVWTFAGYSSTNLSGGWEDETNAINTVNTLSNEGCTGWTPLAEAVCDISNYINTSWPTAVQGDKYLDVLSDGGENKSSGACDGPWSISGPPPPGNYDAGSWQQKTWDNVLGNQIVWVRFWNSVVKSGADYDPETGDVRMAGVADEVFFEDLATSNYGEYAEVLDDAELPWEVVNVDSSVIQWHDTEGDGRVFICPGGGGSWLHVEAYHANGDPMQNTFVRFDFDSPCYICECWPYYAYTDSNGVVDFLMPGGIDASDTTACCVVTVTATVYSDTIPWGEPDSLLNTLKWVSPDLNGDCEVSSEDSLIFMQDYFTSACRSDFDGDGMVSLTDYVYLANHFGHSCGPYSALPETDLEPSVIPRLSQNSPNPFTDATMISFAVGRTGRVRLRIFDVTGRPVKTLVDGIMEANNYRWHWDARDEHGRPVASGVYFYRLESPGYSATRKMVHMK
jgi:hypothetical protein